MRRYLNLVLACLACGAIVAISGLAGARGVVAVTSAAGDIGVQDQAFPINPNKSDFSPTGEKPQSKLWFNGGRWWASMLHSDGHYYIFYLNGQVWTKTSTALDDRIQTQADCLWDGAHLYVASGAGSDPSGADLDGRLYRYSYHPANPPDTAYSLDFGPITIRAGGAETIVLDKDSTGKLWITYTQGSKVYVNHSGASDSDWNAAARYVVPASGANANVAVDDISTLVAYHGKIGVLWSNQNDKKFYFAYHVDGSPDTAWSGGVAWQQSGTPIADDHINIRAVQSDGDGNLFVVVKTSVQNNGPTDPRILVLRRDPAGVWSATVFVYEMEGGKVVHHTRPILEVDSVNHHVYVFATSNTTGGPIVYKESNDYTTGTLSFPSGAGTNFIAISSLSGMNNPTSTKQNVDGANGIDSIAVLASDDAHHIYAHNLLPLNITAPTATTTRTATPATTRTATPTRTRTATPTRTRTATPTKTVRPTVTPRQAPSKDLYLPMVVR